jgi:hypothetical protein
VSVIIQVWCGPQKLSNSNLYQGDIKIGTDPSSLYHANTFREHNREGMIYPIHSPTIYIICRSRTNLARIENPLLLYLKYPCMANQITTGSSSTLLYARRKCISRIDNITRWQTIRTSSVLHTGDDDEKGGLYMRDDVVYIYIDQRSGEQYAYVY